MLASSSLHFLFIDATANENWVKLFKSSDKNNQPICHFSMLYQSHNVLAHSLKILLLC